MGKKLPLKLNVDKLRKIVLKSRKDKKREKSKGETRSSKSKMRITSKETISDSDSDAVNIMTTDDRAAASNSGGKSNAIANIFKSKAKNSKSGEVKTDSP